MSYVRADGAALHVRTEHETLKIEPWGPHSFRVRASRRAVLDSVPHALLDQPDVDAVAEADGMTGTLTNGRGRAAVSIRLTEGYAHVDLQFIDTERDEVVLRDERAHFWWPGARTLSDDGSGYGRLEQRFAANPGERLYGLGQHTHGRLDHKGLVMDLVQRNAEVSIPFVLSNRGYGFLWNSPALGRVEFADNATRWVADRARQIDYWVTISSTPREVLGRYADATGHAPVLPEWATGFWQSKLRYQSQEELLEVAREHRRRGLPLSVIVIDYFAWTRLGDWKFDSEEWPDPAAAIAELEEMGVKLMVSIWPTVNPASENFAEMRSRGMLLGRNSGQPFTATWTDKGNDFPMPVAYYDPTDPAAREFVWSKVKKNYYDDGARVWWLDACEPEIRPDDNATLAFAAGPGSEVANLYPREHARTFWEGMHQEGSDEVVLLCRSAWAGSQRYGAAVWSGDIGVTWEALNQQVRAGMSMAISGIPWWTTDIGGFHGGNPDDPDYRELVVRWFQYAVFCPLFRLHGFREPRTALGASQTGGPNEVWSYGEEAYENIVGALEMRERLRPYVQETMIEAAENGMPPMRALFLEHPDDETAWTIDDEFLLGPDLLVAPVLTAGAATRRVYLPAGREWTELATGEAMSGGTWVDVEAPLDSIPVFLGSGSSATASALLAEVVR